MCHWAACYDLRVSSRLVRISNLPSQRSMFSSLLNLTLKLVQNIDRVLGSEFVPEAAALQNFVRLDLISPTIISHSHSSSPLSFNRAKKACLSLVSIPTCLGTAMRALRHREVSLRIQTPLPRSPVRQRWKMMTRETPAIRRYGWTI